MNKRLAGVALIIISCLAGLLAAQESAPSYLPAEELAKLDTLLDKVGQNQPLAAPEQSELLGYARQLALLVSAGRLPKETEQMQGQLEKMGPYAALAIVDGLLKGQKELAQKLEQGTALTSGDHERLVQLSKWLADAVARPILVADAPKVIGKLVAYGPDAVGPIKAQLLSHSNLAVRLHATLALSRIGDDAALEALLGMVKDNNENEAVRILAIKGCGNSKDARAIEELVKLLEHRDTAMRVAAVKALGQIGDKKVLDGLVKLVAGENLNRKKIFEKIKAARADIEGFKQRILLEVAPGIAFERVELYPDEKVEFEAFQKAEKALAQELAATNLVIVRAAEAISSLTQGEQGKEIIDAKDGEVFQNKIDELAKWWQQQSASATP